MTEAQKEIADQVIKSMSASVQNVVRRRRQTGQPVIVWENGRVVRKDPFACVLPEDKKQG